MGCIICRPTCPRTTTQRRVYMFRWVSMKVSARDHVGADGTWVYKMVDQPGYRLEYNVPLDVDGEVLAARFERYQPWETKIELLGRVQELLRNQKKEKDWRFAFQIKDPSNTFMPSQGGREFEIVILERDVPCDCGGDEYHLTGNMPGNNSAGVVVVQPRRMEQLVRANTESGRVAAGQRESLENSSPCQDTDEEWTDEDDEISLIAASVDTEQSGENMRESWGKRAGRLQSPVRLTRLRRNSESDWYAKLRNREDVSARSQF